MRRPRAEPPTPRLPALAAAALAAVLGGPAQAQSPGAATAAPATPASPPAAASAPARAASGPPIVLRARALRGRPDIEAVAEGEVDLRQGPLELQTDWLRYDQASDLAVARGNVRVRNATGLYTGPELQLHLQRFEGFFLAPEYEIFRLQAGGRAERIDFIDSQRSVARNATYTSCPRDGSGDPPWVLEARRVQIDLEAQQGVAEGAVLRFLGVPILAAPTLSFPLGDARKSGWLPPSIDFDSRSGLNLAVPYYWNIAPNRDATVTPHLITRRGLGVDGEFRYLEDDFQGRVATELLPHDRVAGRSRSAWQFEHVGELPWRGLWHADIVRVSDDEWWKDFPDSNRSLTPRLLSQRVAVERPFSLWSGEGLAYARVQKWQVLQGSEALIVAPYERAPQLGAQFAAAGPAGTDFWLQTEANRFTLPDREGRLADPTGWRWHAIGSLSRTWRAPGWWVTPRASFNAARYELDQPLAGGRRQASRTIPTFSVDAGMHFERQTQAFGHALRQTLEPRVLWVSTPYREQSHLPNFDSAGKDFNFNSIFSENAFSGIDRVSDAQLLTAGVTTRLVDPGSGVEALRLGIVQRYLFRTQRITPEGVPFTQRFSDLFLLGSTGLFPGIGLDGALQYSPEQRRAVRSVLSTSWSPGPFRTVGATYRYTRGLTEQLEIGWQWPLWKSALAPADGQAAGSSRVAAGPCSGAWYSVGRVNYSLKDSRITDSVLGVEYDAGCWIGRVVAERLSTGRSEATTRLLLQLELVGLSRLGSNPLRVLKDNIPGYRLLRDERGDSNPPVPVYE